MEWEGGCLGRLDVGGRSWMKRRDRRPLVTPLRRIRQHAALPCVGGVQGQRVPRSGAKALAVQRLGSSVMGSAQTSCLSRSPPRTTEIDSQS